MEELTEKEYYEIGKAEGLPKRCPILDKCERRMWTLFFLDERDDYKTNTEDNVVRFLKNEKGIDIDYESLIKMSGQFPMTSRSGDNISGDKSFIFSNFCPEVMLFESHDFMYDLPRIAATSGGFNRKWNEKNFYCQHYSECAEFSAYFFEAKHGRKVGSIERKRTYVYLMKNKMNGFYKIGKSNNPKHREKTLQSQEPEVELIAKWEAEAEAEKFLHKEFKEKRKRGEWFSLEEVDIQFITEYMNQKTK